MSNHTVLDSRLRSPIDPCAFLRRLGKALDVNVPQQAGDIISMPFPEISNPGFRDEYLCKEILRKYPGFNLGIDTRQVALDSFLKQESKNRETNERLLNVHASVSTDVAAIFYRAARKSVHILGSFSWSDFTDGLRFGPNSTTRLPKHNAGACEKLSGKPHVTPSAARLAYAVITSAPSWAYNIARTVSPQEILSLRSTDELTFVPKNAKTDRTIAIQPDMNVMLQLAVAYCMRKRLHRWGIDLNHQSVNQSRAKEASITGHLATIDLSNASNSVTCSLVWKMIGDHPYIGQICDPMWYTLMERLRTEAGSLDGNTVEYELFSAMGNGYTFELESLIFWTLAVETCKFLDIPPDVSVYGDDIIIPSGAVSLFQEVLSYAGFELNTEKSFWEGSDAHSGAIFRESCGKHYLNGRDVTPIYVTEPLDTVEAVVLLANNLVRWAKLPYGVDGRIRPVYNWLVSQLPPWARNTYIPFSESNDGLIKNMDACAPPVARLADEDTTQSVPHVCGPKSKTRFTPIGYKCLVFKWNSRSRSSAVTDWKRLTGWLYLRSFKVFRPRSDKVRYDPDEPLTLTSAPLKRTLVLRRRVVTSWTDPGPWVD